MGIQRRCQAQCPLCRSQFWHRTSRRFCRWELSDRQLLQLQHVVHLLPDHVQIWQQQLSLHQWHHTRTPARKQLQLCLHLIYMVRDYSLCATSLCARLLSLCTTTLSLSNPAAAAPVRATHQCLCA